SETMAGGFSLSSADPVAGQKAGEASGEILSMHATIRIDDIDGFIADPKHLGSLIGVVDFPPLGKNIPMLDGVFNLFTPADQPKMKLMVYEGRLDTPTGAYYLAGKKEVRNDPGFDLLKDTTTLFCTLYKGRYKTGLLVGVGVLSL